MDLRILEETNGKKKNRLSHAWIFIGSKSKLKDHAPLFPFASAVTYAYLLDMHTWEKT